MSDDTPADKSTDGTLPPNGKPPESTAGEKEASKPSRGRRWRRRLVGLLLVLIGLAVVLRLTVRWTLPAMLSKAAAAYNLDVRYDRLQLHMLGGDVGLWNVRVVPRGAPEPAPEILRADYIRGDLSVPALLAGRLHVLRAEVDGAEVLLERTADGRVPLLERFTSGPPRPPATRIDFTPPLLVEAVRLHKVKARIRDAYVTPQTDVVAWMDLRLSDLGVPGRRAQFEADAWAENLVDSLRLSGEGHADGQTLDAAAQVSVRGLRPKAVAKYLEPLGVRPVADTVAVQLNVAADTRPVSPPASGPASRPLPGDGGGGRWPAGRGGGVARHRPAARERKRAWRRPRGYVADRHR